MTIAKPKKAEAVPVGKPAKKAEADSDSDSDSGSDSEDETPVKGGKGGAAAKKPAAAGPKAGDCVGLKKAADACEAKAKKAKAAEDKKKEEDERKRQEK